MKKSLTLIFVPSDKLINRYPVLFHEFPERNLAAISEGELQYFPVNSSPDLLLIKDTELKRKSLQDIASIADEYQYYHIAQHAGSRYLHDQRIDIEALLEPEKIAYLNYHRVDTDLFHQSFLKVIDCIKANSTLEAYERAREELDRSIGVNWELESALVRHHQATPFPENLEIPKDTLVIWNSDSVQDIHNCKNIVTDSKSLSDSLKGKKRLLILSELNWDDYKLSQFHGYQLAAEIISGSNGIEIAFASMLPRKVLKSINNPYAQLLVPIFPHIELPIKQEFEKIFQTSPSSTISWNIIRNYYIKQDGLIDRLIHELQKLNENSSTPEILNFLQKIQSFSKVLTPEIVDAARQMRPLISRHPEALRVHLAVLRNRLYGLYQQTVLSAAPKLQKSSSKIMIIEDDKAALNRLKDGFNAYFQGVDCFYSGETAWQHLKENPRTYSALIVDLELLDDDGFWQPMQGFELIEHASVYPHLVIYILTGYSRRALNFIQDSATSRAIGYQPKGKIHELPLHINYALFSEQLQAQINARAKYRKGPQIGVWANGLLEFYYQFLESKEGHDLWNEIEEVVDKFISEGNKSGIVPQTLFHVGLREFNLSHLRTVLSHRLIALYSQYSNPEHQLNFDEDLKDNIGFKAKEPKQYFNSRLGLSAINRGENENGNSRIFSVQLKDLFPEEISWLKKKFPNVFNIRHPELVSMLNYIVSDIIMPIQRNNDPLLKRLPKSVQTLYDCEKALKVLSQRRPENKSKMSSQWSNIIFDIKDYIENQPEELESIKRDPDGMQIHRYLVDFDQY